MVKGYDNIALNEGLVLDLTFQEGSGILTHDRAKPNRHTISLVGAPVWTQTPLANLTVLNFGGANYLECAAADTVDLDFTAGDYSIVAWVKWVWDASTQMLLARYELDKTGWELYFTCNIPGSNYLTLRHHHTSLGADTRDGCFSSGWAEDVWSLVGITRQKSGGTSYPLHYRNGTPVVVTYDAGGLKDPDSSAKDLVNVRYTKNTNFYKGDLYRPRIWSRCLSAFEMLMLFEMERSLFGV